MRCDNFFAFWGQMLGRKKITSRDGCFLLTIAVLLHFFASFSRVHAKAVVLRKTACFCPSKRLLSAFYNTPPLLRTLLRTFVSIEALTRAPSKNPSKKHLLFENLLRALLRSARLHDPPWCAPLFSDILDVLGVLEPKFTICHFRMAPFCISKKHYPPGTKPIHK